MFNNRLVELFCNEHPLIVLQIPDIKFSVVYFILLMVDGTSLFYLEEGQDEYEKDGFIVDDVEEEDEEEEDRVDSDEERKKKKRKKRLLCIFQLGRV